MSSPIKDVLKTLNQHATLVEEALDGVVDSEGQASKASDRGLATGQRTARGGR